MKRITHILLATTLSLGFANVHAADPFPNKPIRIVSPYSAGGTNDFLARLSGSILGDAFGQTTLVENRLGAGGIIGSNVVAQAPADGYTLLLGSISTHSIGPTIYSKLPYDINANFTPISIVADVPLVLVVHPSVAANTLPELLALIRKQPNKYNFASAGSGTIPHMTGELFKTMTKAEITHVPYKGDSMAMNDLVGGQVQMMFANMPSAINFVRQGQLRAIAVAGKTRSPALPEVPTMQESGIPGFDVTGWFALFGPGKMPSDVVNTLNTEIVKGLRKPENQARIRAQGAEPVGNSVKEFTTFLAADQAKWKRTAATTGIKLD
jgi:tripartite-type tricarboxylate transporter receptor subunit TctC